jgi:hypothetical protein
MKPRSGETHWRSGAFSTVELLAVCALIFVLIGFAIPTVPSLVGSRGMTKALTDISFLIERARNEAMTMQSVVWLAFETTINDEGDYEVRAVLLAPLDGSVTTVTQAGKLQISAFAQETEIYHWPNLKLAPLSSVPEARALSDVASESLGGQKKQAFRFGKSADQIKQYQVITFTPQGYAMLVANPKITAPYTEAIDLGLIPMRGAEEARDKQGAALIVNGFNGKIQVLRP